MLEDSHSFGPIETWQPHGHSDDPFACPCCANVFAEVLELTEIDLSEHGRRLPTAVRPEQASLLLTNARILTMDETLPDASCMWVRNGRIHWLGESADIPDEARDDEVVDCDGRFVMPGFVEPHMHLAPLAMLREFVDVRPFRCETVAAVLATLQQAQNSLAANEWLVARQFDPSLQIGPELTTELLDSVSSTQPVFVYNASLHIAYCNSAALQIAGIDASTPDPQGAELGRYADGAPNGVLKAGPAMALVARHNPNLRQRNLAQACLDVFADANRVGITTLCDQGTGLFQGANELELYQLLRDSERMTVRFRYSVSQVQAPKWDERDLSWGEGDAWLRRTGWKIVSDGSNQGRTGLQRQAFLNSNDHGLAYIETDELNAAVEQRLREGWAVCVHANGDAAIDRVLDAFTLARDAGLDPASKRCRIEHCSILHDEQIQRMADLGLSPSFLIGHVHYWGSAFIDDVFGLEKTEKLDRTGACEAMGIRWTIHSDDPVTQMGPLRCIENAVTRSMWRSDEILAPVECVDVSAALRAMTIDAAWQCHSDHEVGSLAVGKCADFVVLQADPRAVEASTIGALDVLETWVDGRCVYQNAASA